MNNPTLVNELLSGKKRLWARLINPDESFGNKYEIAFKETNKSEDGWAAAILYMGKPITKPCRKIALDFEILTGLYDILRLLAAFIDPDSDIVFIIGDDDSSEEDVASLDSSYRVYYEKSQEEKRRCVAPYNMAS